jgi:hypothetical protein
MDERALGSFIGQERGDVYLRTAVERLRDLIRLAPSDRVQVGLLVKVLYSHAMSWRI